MTTKTRVGILFGGRSGEHEVSLQSARSVIATLNPAKYEITLIGIDHQGRWFSGPETLNALDRGDTRGLVPVTLLPEPGEKALYARHEEGGKVNLEKYAELDVIFPVLHGTFGEDGTVQGLLELSNIAYVGAGVLASSVGMDKGLFKDVMRSHNLPVLDARVFTRSAIQNALPEVIRVAESLAAYPLFVKPANLGSSVGVTKCRSRNDLMEGLFEAARYDRRILVERGLESPREIEISVLGNNQPKASIPGEIIPGEDFYTYSAKYISDRSKLLIPAALPAETIEQIQKIAVEAYRAIDGAGMARVDFLVDPRDNAVYLSEVNTIPGFTRISMYPKLWDASGLPYPALVETLIELALERKAERDSTEFVYRREE